MSTIDGYVDEIESFVDDVIEWRAEASAESREVPTEFGKDVISFTAVNFFDHTLDVLEAAGELIEADRQGMDVSQVEDVIHEYNEARFSQMTTWYEHRTAVENVESELSESRDGNYPVFAEDIQENIWEGLDATRQVHEHVQETDYAQEVENQYEELMQEEEATVNFIESIEQAYDDVSFQEGMELLEEEGNPAR
ncbi:hypothetical protein ACK3SF_03070 [Candidatus Nanosalina sp. VS9-1]|uniref:hypothetical protein n=1 Tax=Candidatus Nanosalina sp. VS9-1 TaxID=3388566 RepID=UPI0039DF879D